MYKIKFVDFGKQYRKYQTEIDVAISRVLNNGKLILQEDVIEFEEKLAKFVGTKYAIGLNSGTDALYLSLLALGVGKGDEVFVPSHTFVATAQVVRQLGAKVETFDMDGKFVISEKTKAIIPAHIAGELSMYQNFNIPVIEDACQALGAVKNPTSLAQCWSFYPAKILGCFGDGGAVTTNDKEFADEIRELRNHYKKDYSQWGINSRLDNLQAAVLSVRIEHLEEMIQRRAEIAKMYDEGLKGNIMLPNKQPGRVYQDYIIRLSSNESRDRLFSFLKERGVETMKNEYPMPIIKMPMAGLYESETLRLPCNDVLEDDEINYVIEQVNAFKE